MGRKKKAKSKEIVESDPEEAPDEASIKKKRSTRGGGKNPQFYKKLGKLN